MRKTILTFIIIGVLVTSCKDNIENELSGSWVVEQAYYNDEVVQWDLYTNAIQLNKDKTCDLPPIHSREERTLNEGKGIWEALEKQGNSYLQIKTENWIFNRTFEIHNLRKVRDNKSFGFLMKMTLTADSLKLDCTKALYD